MKISKLVVKILAALLAIGSCTCQTPRKPQLPAEPSTTLNNFTFLVDQVYPQAAPQRNRAALVRYISSPEFKQHKSSTTAYFNAREMSEADARLVLENRDPVNIAMHTGYDAGKLQQLLTRLHHEGLIHTPIVVDQKSHSSGFRNSAYTKELHLASKPALPFSSGAFTVCVYSETFLWPRWNGSEEGRKEVAVISVPAPALDSRAQPNYSYYVQNEILNQSRYEAEMRFLAKTIVKAAKDNATKAFGGKGIKRLVLGRFGQVNFIAALAENQKDIAHRIFSKTLSDEISKAKLGIDVLLNVFSPEIPSVERKFYKDANIEVVTGDILVNARDQDFIVNAWDPHSLPGNGNDSDNSLDGILGRASAILLTQSPYFNERIRYIGVDR